MVRSSFEVADFFIDEPIFLRNMRIFKKKSAKYRGKSALPNLMCSTLLRLEVEYHPFAFKIREAHLVSVFVRKRKIGGNITCFQHLI